MRLIVVNRNNPALMKPMKPETWENGKDSFLKGWRAATAEETRVHDYRINGSNEIEEVDKKEVIKDTPKKKRKAKKVKEAAEQITPEETTPNTDITDITEP